MIVRSPRPETNWTVIQNTVLRNATLSFKARGLLAYLLSLPDNWMVSAERIALDGPDGRDSIRSALRELVDAGYVRRERRQDNRGRWTTRHVVYDQPQIVGLRLVDPYCEHPVEKAVGKHGDN